VLGRVLSTIPPERMSAVVPWIIERVSPDDGDAYLTVLEHATLPEVFPAAKGWIRDGVSAERWDDLSERRPQLTT
jgi:hypothetical protein